MKTIELKPGVFAIVDACDYEYLRKFHWFINGTGYAVRNLPRKGGRCIHSKMHREILGLSKMDKVCVDHINENKFDNRRENLRICSRSENGCNRGAQSNNKSGFKGVCWSKQKNKWIAQISFNKKTKHLGFFESAEDAHKAYCVAADAMHGNFANPGTRRQMRDVVNHVMKEATT